MMALEAEQKKKLLQTINSFKHVKHKDETPLATILDLTCGKLHVQCENNFQKYQSPPHYMCDSLHKQKGGFTLGSEPKETPKLRTFIG